MTAQDNDNQASQEIDDIETSVIRLCVSQIGCAWGEAQKELDAMVAAITTLAGSVGDPQAPKGLETAVNELFRGMQFADKLNQRIANSSEGMILLAQWMEKQEVDGKDLLRQVRDQYTTERERQRFDEVFPDLVLESAESDADEEITLF